MSFVEKSPSLWLFCYSGLKRLRHGSWCSLCIYFWLCWKEIALCRLSLVAVSGVRAWVWYTGFSLQWLLWLWSAISRHIGFSSCATQAQQYQLAGSRGWAQGLRSMDLLTLQHLESFSTRDRTCVTYSGRRIFVYCATSEVLVSGFDEPARTVPGKNGIISFL